MKFSKTLLASAVSVILLSIAGCADDAEQDIQESDETSFTGLVIDGRVARGLVWVDIDNDAVIDTFETYAYTDADGYYGYNPLTNTNYCDEGENQTYCLKSSMPQDKVTIRIAGGIDLSTGEPFRGVMTLNTDISAAKEVAQQVSEASSSSESKPDFMPVVSPLTTLTGDGTFAEKVDTLLALGIPGIDETNIVTLLTTDFTDFSAEELEELVGTSGRISALSTNKADGPTYTNLYGYAFQYQKTVDTLTTLFNKYLEKNNIDITKDENDNPLLGSSSYIIERGISEFIYSQVLFSRDENLLANLTDQDMQSILDYALSYMWRYYIPVPPVPPAPPAPEIYQLVNQRVNAPIVNQVLDAPDGSSFETGLISAQTVVNSTQKNTDDLLSDDPTAALDKVRSVSDAVQTDEFKNAVQATLVGNKTIDVKQLTDDLESGKSAEDSVSNSTLAEAPAAGDPGIWANKALSMSGKSNAGEAGRMLMFFSGTDNTVKSGNVSICYAFNANDNSKDVEATLLKGTWQELNSRGIVQLNDDLVSFTIKALKREPIPEDQQSKYLGLTSSDPTTGTFGHFRFAYEDRQEIWFSDGPVTDEDDKFDFGLTDQFNGASITAPTTAAQCETALGGALYDNVFP